MQNFDVSLRLTCALEIFTVIEHEIGYSSLAYLLIVDWTSKGLWIRPLNKQKIVTTDIVKCLAINLTQRHLKNAIIKIVKIFNTIYTHGVEGHLWK